MAQLLRQITVLSGGVGGARFVRGLRHGIAVAEPYPASPRTPRSR